MSVVRCLTGADLREALTISAQWLERHAEAINALNVFPVPDGDTGLNMSLTLRSAADYAVGEPGTRASDVAAAMARGALMGARGNSGVILAQLLRGMSTAVIGCETIDGKDLARALADGATAAYGAVSSPVEGTILTVARAAADSALEAAASSVDIVTIIERAEQSARAAVEHTPDLLPVLRQASVVDAGGEGYRVFLSGLTKYLRGEPIGEGEVHVEVRADLTSLHPDGADFFGYCTEVLFRGEQLNSARVRERLASLGSSVLVVGGDEMLKVHVHTLRPGAVLDLATDLGEIVRVKVENMQLQHEQFAAGAPAAVAPRGRASGTRLVSVAQGKGFQQLFASLGAVVVAGGPTMNPSVEEIAAAIERANCDRVIVLPNNRNVVLAAEAAARVVEGSSVAVVATENLPQGVAAALALNPEAGIAANVASLTRAARRCRTIEMTRAVRDARFDDLSVEHGMPFAIVDGRPAASEATFERLVAAALDRLSGDTYELATVYPGADGSPEVAAAIAAVVQERLAIPVEILAGGEPTYDYIISVE